MFRRDLLAAAVTLAAPALAQTAAARTLIFVPQANLTSLDPIWTTATVTRNYAYLVFDTLYGTDDELRPRPQMAEGHSVDDNGRRWTIRLRAGLVFHDGTPVLARDCTASLARWMKRDSLGGSLAGLLDAMEAPDDRTIVLRLKRSFPPLLDALAKTQPSPAMIMPERIARTDPFTPITEVVGSGPFRFLAAEYVSGSRAAFARHEGYVPREDAPSSVAGAKRAMVDRVEWRIIPEAQTAVNALRAGEVDWLEMPIPDLLPSLRSARDVVVGRLDPYGLYPVMRFNHLHPPTSVRGVRQAILAAIDQKEVMQAVMGDDATTYNAPVGCFLPGTAWAGDAGMDRLAGRHTDAEVRAMLKEAGYDGTPAVLLHATDQPFYDAMSQVCAAAMKRVGIAVEDAAMDFGTVVQRRNSREAPARGGWSVFCTSFPALDFASPLSAPALRGNGLSAWYGWPTDPTIEALRETWIDSTDAAQQRRLASAIQQEALTEAFYVPLGQYFQSAAWRSNIGGQLKGQPPLFWNVTKG